MAREKCFGVLQWWIFRRPGRWRGGEGGAGGGGGRLIGIQHHFVVTQKATSWSVGGREQATGPVALTLAYSAINTPLICQLRVREWNNMTSLNHQQLRHALLHRLILPYFILYKRSLWPCEISKTGKKYSKWCNTNTYCTFCLCKNRPW